MDLQHDEPAWKHKADSIIGSKITDPQYAKQYSSEQLWAREVEDGLYEICCIPFALYDLFLGDIVSVSKDLELGKVTKHSGHLGFRIATEGSRDQDVIADKLHALGCLTERHSGKLLAVDADDLVTAREVAGLLQQAEDAHEILQYEAIKS